MKIDTRCSSQVCMSGPIFVRHVHPKTAKMESDKKFAVQVVYGWKPLLLSTARCFTRVVVQSQIPVFVMSHISTVLISGENVALDVEPFVKVVDNGATVSYSRPRDEPFDEYLEVFCADMRRYNENTEVMVADGTRIKCHDVNRVVCSPETRRPQMGNRLAAPTQKREKPEHAPLRVAMKRVKGVEKLNKLPTIAPRRQCLLRLLKQSRVHDYLLLEAEFIRRQNVRRPLEVQRRNERRVVHQLRGTPTTLARVHELFEDEKHAVVIVEGSKREWYVPILSIVDKDLLRLNALVMVKAGGMFKNVPTAVVGVLDDKVDSNAMGHKVEKAPKETFEDIGGCESQIQEIKESVELPLTHPEYYEEMGITAPKGVILYGEPGTGKTLLAKAVANSTSATFIRATGSELVQKHGGEGAKLVRELFKMAKESAPCIVFLDEIDAVGTKRFDTSSRGEQEVQRTLLELLNQLDGFESRGDVKVIMATNRIDSLDPALIRPGRIDRKIELPRPDEKTRAKIFSIHSNCMNVAKDVTYDSVLAKEKSISGAEIKAVCTEAGMLALRAQRKTVMKDDFDKAVKSVLLKTKAGAPEEFYL
ncbi:unnamed protein product [Caenorhabditis auriculariae]|uniref:AAA+ ATPase domain-containing protein n=1 Tax=Caenorhabditis auriculariae TaxID=2777116 RepID=A0A8S1H0P3_9PELO|nr:unnamed protein product [Caenorhabditis auriculariae]